MEVGFFLCLKNGSPARKDTGMPAKVKISGGGSRARKNHIGMYRVQTAELQHDKREKEPSGPDGNQQILQILQEAHTAQGNEVRCRKG
jgi:hypothetical protein